VDPTAEAASRAQWETPHSEALAKACEAVEGPPVAGEIPILLSEFTYSCFMPDLVYVRLGPGLASHHPAQSSANVWLAGALAGQTLWRLAGSGAPDLVYALAIARGIPESGGSLALESGAGAASLDCTWTPTRAPGLRCGRCLPTRAEHTRRAVGPL
jgi:hypothetical protein